MERDFMGLAEKNENPDEINDLAPERSLAMHWSFSNKDSTLPQLLSFQDFHEEKPKTGFNSLTSTGLLSITTSQAFDSDYRQNSRVIQKHVIPEKQAGPWYMMTTHSANQLDSPARKNLIGSAIPQPLAVNPIQAIPSNIPVLETTDLRNVPKISTAPAQLTIFYAGSVCVYDNISPEKAQAIMLLAGNVPPATSSPTIPAAPVQVSMPRSSVLDGFVISHPYGSTPYYSKPVPVTALSMSHSVGRSGINNRTTVSPGGVIISSSSKIDPMKVVNSSGSVPASLLASTVPQFRRKSLARFLEKRKERIVSQAPYTDKQTLDSNTPESGNTNMSVNSSGSGPVTATI